MDYHIDHWFCATFTHKTHSLVWHFICSPCWWNEFYKKTVNEVIKIRKFNTINIILGSFETCCISDVIICLVDVSVFISMHLYANFCCINITCLRLQRKYKRAHFVGDTLLSSFFCCGCLWIRNFIHFIYRNSSTFDILEQHIQKHHECCSKWLRMYKTVKMFQNVGVLY